MDITLAGTMIKIGNNAHNSFGVVVLVTATGLKHLKNVNQLVRIQI